MAVPRPELCVRGGIVLPGPAFATLRHVHVGDRGSASRFATSAGMEESQRPAADRASVAGVVSDAVRQGVWCLSSRSFMITKLSFRLGRIMGPIRQIIGSYVSHKGTRRNSPFRYGRGRARGTMMIPIYKCTAVPKSSIYLDGRNY